METKTDTFKAELSREEEIKIQVVRSFLEDLFGVFMDVFEPFTDLLRIMESPEFAALLETKANDPKHHTRKRRNCNRVSSTTNRRKERVHERTENGT